MRLLAAFAAFVLFGFFGFFGTVAQASAAPEEDPPSRAAMLAWRLSKDPVQVTDHALRAVRPDDAARIKALVARLNVPVFVVVEPEFQRGIRNTPGELIQQLHQRLRKDGIYLVVDADGSAAARQYGGELPVAAAWSTASMELPDDTRVIRLVQRWVEILTAPDVRKRIDEPLPRPKEPPTRSEIRDQKETRALGLGTAIGCVPLLIVLLVVRIRKAVRR